MASPGTNLLLAVALACGPLLAGAPVAADPGLPLVSVHPAEIHEGGTARVVLTLDHAVTNAVSVRFFTHALTAARDVDYEATGQTVEIAPGGTRVVVPVPTLQDALDEATETFRVRIVDPGHAQIGRDRATVAIRDDDAVPGVTPLDATIDEPVQGNRIGFADVRLSAPSGRRVVVQVAQRPGTAMAGDFVPLSPVLVFAPGETSHVVRIEVLADDRVEGPETLRLVVVVAHHARPTRRATVTIRDADSREGRMGR